MLHLSIKDRPFFLCEIFGLFTLKLVVFIFKANFKNITGELLYFEFCEDFKGLRKSSQKTLHIRSLL